MAMLLNKRETPGSKVQDWTRRGLLALGMDNYGANKWAHKVTSPLLALTPLGAAEDAVNKSREYAGMMRRGQQLPLMGGLPVAMAAVGGIPSGRAMRAFHAGPGGIDVFRASAGGAVGPGLYVAKDVRDASYWAKKLGQDAHIYELDIPSGPYATKAQFFAEVNRLGGATLDTIQEVHAQAARNLAARGFAGVKNGNEYSVFDPAKATKAR